MNGEAAIDFFICFELSERGKLLFNVPNSFTLYFLKYFACSVKKLLWNNKNVQAVLE